MGGRRQPGLPLARGLLAFGGRESPATATTARPRFSGRFPSTSPIPTRNSPCSLRVSSLPRLLVVGLRHLGTCARAARSWAARAIRRPWPRSAWAGHPGILTSRRGRSSNPRATCRAWNVSVAPAAATDRASRNRRRQIDMARARSGAGLAQSASYFDLPIRAARDLARAGGRCCGPGGGRAGAGHGALVPGPAWWAWHARLPARIRRRRHRVAARVAHARPRPGGRARGVPPPSTTCPTPSGARTSCSPVVPVIALTRGLARPAALHARRVQEVATLPRAEKDPTGAGDVFGPRSSLALP